MAGNIIAFQDFSPFRGIAGSDWVGLKHFSSMFVDPEIRRALYNTVVIALLQLFFAFPAPILLALLLNSLLSERSEERRVGKEWRARRSRASESKRGQSRDSIDRRW